MKRLFTVVIGLTLSHLCQAGLLKTNFFTDSGAVAHAGASDAALMRAAEPARVGATLTERRLDSVQKEVPLDYNEYVQNYIDLYTAPGRRSDMGRIIGLSKYYFPIYEKAFREAGIPTEIKFLSIVESELNPNAVSRVGATGPWQFMYTTGKVLGLNIDSYVDERRDPIQASYAAAAYLKDAYQEFGDWLLAIASYNCGKSSVERAIDKAGGATDFWSIRQYLPPETRNYVPAYIAMTYVMNYFNYHNITPQAADFYIRTDTVMVNRTVSLSNVSKALDMDAKNLFILNPCYIRGVVNGTKSNARRLIIPQTGSDKYVALYNLLNNDTAPAMAYNNTRQQAGTPVYHTVRPGETLAAIAGRYNIAVQDLKAWNNLQANWAAVGKRLRVSENSPTGDEDISAKKADKKYVLYKVRKGDTLSGVAEKFEADMQDIKELNGLKRDVLQPGMTLKISKV